MKLLVADDDRDLVDLIRYALRRAGHTVVTAFDGDSTLKVFHMEKPDLIILDLIMPAKSGIDVLQEIRKETDVPIIILSALRDEDHIVAALYKGADDYMVKPFGPRELTARTKALLRRTMQHPDDSEVLTKPLVLGEISLYPETREVFAGGKKIRLTRTEFELLKYLMMNHHTVRSFQDLLSNVWGYDSEQNTEVVKVTISRLRRKLEWDPKISRNVINIPGVGYRFQVDDLKSE